MSGVPKDKKKVAKKTPAVREMHWQKYENASVQVFTAALSVRATLETTR